MAQRNPMNDRYQGDGPQGKTRKSAAKLKPKAEAASSVHIDKKPTNKQERKAARKKRDAQIAAKEAERKRKAEEREKKERLAAGEEIEEPKKPGFGQKAKKLLIGPTPAPGQAAANRQNMNRVPNTPEYRRLKRIYWALMAIGGVSIALSLLFFQSSEEQDNPIIYVLMGTAYGSIIIGFILHYTKIRKMEKEHLQTVSGSKGSPKQLKHEQQKAEAARLLEEHRQAQKAQKRANSKLAFMRKSKEDGFDDSDGDENELEGEPEDVSSDEPEDVSSDEQEGASKDDPKENEE